jgi:hypothetical protein
MCLKALRHDGWWALLEHLAVPRYIEVQQARVERTHAKQ